MRTKTLLLTAALSAAGVAASMAQVYSVNVVGYVNTTVPAGKWAILANPLNNGTNDIATLFTMPTPDDPYDGSLIFRYKGETGAYLDSLQYYAGFGWFNLEGTTALNPGEGFWVKASAGDLNLTFVGEVQQGTMSTWMNGGGTTGKWNLVGAQVPQSIPVGDATAPTTTMGFPAVDGDLIFQYDAVTQGYKESYQYYDGYGWFSSTDPSTAGPVITPGSGFWVYKNGPAVNWARTFYVQ